MKLTIRTFIALLILSLCCLSNTQDRKSNGLFVVIVNDKRGYIDRNGRIVIKPQLLLNGKWGLIDKTGKILFQTKFSLMHEFRGGLAQVYEGEDLTSTKIGYIDRAGNLVWQPSR